MAVLMLVLGAALLLWSHIIWLALPCSPCLSAYNNRLAVECRNNLCMKGITVDRVYETVRGILGRRGAADSRA